MSYSITALTDDYYEGTNCLINKFNIQNEDQLAKIEASITLAKTAELERKAISTSICYTLSEKATAEPKEYSWLSLFVFAVMT